MPSSAFFYNSTYKSIYRHVFSSQSITSYFHTKKEFSKNENSLLVLVILYYSSISIAIYTMSNLTSFKTTTEQYDPFYNFSQYTLAKQYLVSVSDQKSYRTIYCFYILQLYKLDFQSITYN